MSPVLQAVHDGDLDAALTALERMTPADRSREASRVREAYQGWLDGDWKPGEGGTLKWAYSAGTDAQRRAAVGCLAAIATAAQLAKGPQLPGLFDAELLVEVAARVPPRWLDPDGLRTLIDAQRIGWRAVEAMVAAGLCERPHEDGFVEAMIEGVGFRSKVPLVELLRQTPGLVQGELLYRVFEVEGGQQSSLAAADKYRNECNRWSTALLALTETGELDRARLLDGCLDALARDFAPFRAGWFSRFHDALAPDLDERQARTGDYLRLLGSQVPATVSFAVKALTTLGKKRPLPADALLAALPPALQAKQKGTVTRTTALLLRAVKQQPDARVAATELLIDALVHPDVAVQTALLDAIDGLLPDAGAQASALRTRLAEAADLLAPSLRARVGASEPPPADAPPAPPPETLTDPLHASLRWPAPDDLLAGLDAVAHALEHPLDPLAHERALDVVSRHPAPSGDWATLRGPLAKRAAALWRRGSLSEHMTRFTTTWVVLQWTRGTAEPWPLSYGEDKHDFAVFLGRARAVVERVLQGGPALPLLSTPTHTSGALAAATVIERAARWHDAAHPIDLHDAVLGLMRTDDPAAARSGLPTLDAPALDLCATPPQAAYALRVESRTSDGYTFHRVLAEPEGERPETIAPLHLWLALVHGDDLWTDDSLGRWLGTVTPHHLSPYFAVGVRHLGEYNLDETRASGLYLEPAREPWATLGDAGHQLLMLCLAARGARAIEVGLDVAIDGLEQGRVNPERLGDALGILMPSGALKAKRVATTLAQVAAVSPAHAQAVTTVIARGLRGDPQHAPRDISSVLSLLHELLSARGGALQDDTARDWLERMSRGGATAKLRKRLLQ